MREQIEGIIRSKIVIACAAILALVLLCIAATVVFGQGSGSPAPTTSLTQPDDRPTTLSVVTEGTGVSPTNAAAALQQPATSSDLGASTNTQSSLMGQAGLSLQAGVGGMNVEPATGLPAPKTNDTVQPLIP